MDPILIECYHALLDHLTDPDGDACSLNPDPCRVAVYPGAEVAWDTCESLGCGSGKDGQLWTAAQPAIIQEQGGGCRRIIWTAEVGIVRCAAGPRGDGSPPRVSEVEADAVQQAVDAATIRRALICQCPGKPECLADVELVSWRPLGPSGGCVGGAWTIRGMLNDCC